MHESIEVNHAGCLYSTFHPALYGLELGVSILENQGGSRHRKEAAQAPQRKFRQQDDGFSMIVSKQSEITKVGLSAPAQHCMLD